jgi:predicted ATPase
VSRLCLTVEFDDKVLVNPHVTAIILNLLGEREITAIIEGITGNKPLPAAIRQDIIDGIDGTPLFVEQMTKKQQPAGR